MNLLRIERSKMMQNSPGDLFSNRKDKRNELTRGRENNNQGPFTKKVFDFHPGYCRGRSRHDSRRVRRLNRRSNKLQFIAIFNNIKNETITSYLVPGIGEVREPGS